MPATHSSGHHDPPPPKTTRRPLQPKNHQSPPSITSATNPRKPINPPAANCTNNKENQPHFYPNPTVLTKRLAEDEMDASLSLADELSAVREKLERQRIDREKNDKLLRERASALDLQLKEILSRGEIQKQLEIELDRLYRLREIRLACTRISQIRSLRDKEDEKKKKQGMEQIQAHEDEEGKGESSSIPDL